MSKIEIGVGVLLVLTAPSQQCHHKTEEPWDLPGTSFVRELNKIDPWGVAFMNLPLIRGAHFLLLYFGEKESSTNLDASQASTL